MSFLRSILHILSLFSLLCSFEEIHGKGGVLTFDEVRTQLSGVKKEKKKKKTGLIDSVLENGKLRKELRETKKRLDAYRYITKLRRNGPFIMKSLVIEEASMIGAQTQGAIRATGQVSRVILSNLKGVDLPADSKISCEVRAKYKRICGSCTRLIIDGKGQDIDATLHNKDGSNCAVGELYDQDEKYLVGALISAGAKGALAVSQSSIPTVGGNLIENSVSNKYKQAAIGVADEATDMFRERANTEEATVFLERNQRVVVFFNKGVEL